MNNSVLITGVAGFIGRTLARHYYEQGREVNGIDIVAPENAPTSFLKSYLRANLPDPRFVQLIKATNPAECIHCAGRASVLGSMLQPFDDYIQGPEMTFYVLNSLWKSAPACKFLLLSSAAVYGNSVKTPIEESFQPAPISPYGFHKWQSEIICHEFHNVYGLATACVRVFSAYGPGLRRQVIWDTCRKMLMTKDVIMKGTGEESRDFIHVVDIARGVERVMRSSPLAGDVYNLANGQEVKIKNLAALIGRSLGFENRIIFDGNVEQGDPLNWVANIDKVRSLGFAPSIPFQKGIEATATWCKAELMG